MNEPSVPKGSRFSRWRERIRGMLPFASGVVATLLALILYGLFFPNSQLTTKEVNEAVAIAMASATPRPPFSEEVYHIIQPSIIMIESEMANGEKSLGSGVIIDDAGDILTALHVVDGASLITVIFADGTHSEAQVSNSQPEMDIAVLQAMTMPQQFVPAVLGNPGTLQVGDDVYAVGHPFGLYGSMSAGIVSGFDRTFQPKGSQVQLKGLIQFDAAANPGNSGGPLLNREGQVVGIVTGLVNPTQDSFFVGIAFAVPITTAAGGAGMPPY